MSGIRGVGSNRAMEQGLEIVRRMTSPLIYRVFWGRVGEGSHSDSLVEALYKILKRSLEGGAWRDPFNHHQPLPFIGVCPDHTL